MRFMKKIIFLDRDGTINVEKDYLHKIEDFQFEEGAQEAIKIFKELGYEVIVLTNQSGIARGYYSEEDLINLNNYMIEEVKKFGGDILDAFYCPHHPTKGVGKYKVDCDCRKPHKGMLIEASKKYDIDFSNSFMVGDKNSDVELTKDTEITPVLVRTGYGRKSEKSKKIDCLVFDNLLNFAYSLKKHCKNS